jgi:hypothetical protein
MLERLEEVAAFGRRCAGACPPLVANEMREVADVLTKQSARLTAAAG